MKEEGDSQRGYVITRVTQFVSNRVGTKSLDLQAFQLVITFGTQGILASRYAPTTKNHQACEETESDR